MNMQISRTSTLPLWARGSGARVVIVVLVAWSLAWKAASLWRAARDGSKPWFTALLLTNTLGALDAIYLFEISEARRRDELDEDSILAATGEPEQLGHTQET